MNADNLARFALTADLYIWWTDKVPFEQRQAAFGELYAIADSAKACAGLDAPIDVEKAVEAIRKALDFVWPFLENKDQKRLTQWAECFSRYLAEPLGKARIEASDKLDADFLKREMERILSL